MYSECSHVMNENLKEQFLLDPDIIFLNNGSFGACPRPVFEDYQRWQQELERRPVEFLGRQAVDLLGVARVKLGEYLTCDADDVVYFPNPTTAINMVARSLNLKPGDEILTTNHEYGAMSRTWRFICSKTGAKYIKRSVPLPVTSQDVVVENFWQGVTDRTQVIFISHITSPTALVFPVKEICRRARDAGILSIVDGAHAPGQITVNVSEIGADFYTGACHKWMLSPKGSSFLYASNEVQESLDPLVVSWGYECDPGFGSGNQFIDYHEWQGTRDIAAFLSVPAAIEFMAANDWERVRDSCHNLSVNVLEQINALTGLDSICSEGEKWFGQMVSARLPEVDIDDLQAKLYSQYQIEIPLMRWNDQPLIRVSIQAYNSQDDVDKLLEVLSQLL